MNIYTFYHFSRGGAASGLTFAEFASDEAAMAGARELVDWHHLAGVEVCQGARELGRVERDLVGSEPLQRWPAAEGARTANGSSASASDGEGCRPCPR